MCLPPPVTKPPMKPIKQPDKQKDKYQAIAKYSGLGVEMAAAVLGSAFLGQWLDKRAGHDTPLYTLVLSFLGVAYVFYRLFKISSE